MLQNVGRRVVGGIGRRCLSTDAQRDVKKEKDPRRSFYHSDLIVEKASPAEMKPKPGPDTPLGFGVHFSDHMSEVDWTAAEGWTKPIIHPLRNLSIHPGVKALHYAIQLFEGMKAYRGMDGKIRLFRPDLNMYRMRRSAKRAALPDFDAEELIKIISEQVRIDADWVPSSTSQSLYIRPTFIGTDPTLGVAQPNEAKLFVLTGPVGQYFSTGFKPTSLLADSKYVRAFPGGVGAYKMGSNYGPTIRVGSFAAAKNCQQVLWLHGEREEITEAGTMNIFMLWYNEEGDLELLTPPLEKGLILPGVTRQSLLDLGRQWGEFEVVETHMDMRQLRRAIKEKRVIEMFGAGTAAVVSPIGHILYNNRETNQYEDLLIPTMESKYGVMKRFYQTMNDIHYGKIEQPGWTREI